MSKMLENTCPKCNVTFSCGSTCWCGDFPKIIPINLTKGCLCNECLKENIVDQINEWMNPLTLSNSIKIKDLGPVGKPIEGIDYSMSEKNQMVLSGWFLLRRGYCCGNGCTNCPYDGIIK